MPPLERDAALVLLAAGRSVRFGDDKLTRRFRGRPLWEWAASAAEEAGFRHRFVVTNEQFALPPRAGWQRVTNPHAAEGMGTSIAAGVRAAAAHTRIVIALADMPLVTASHLRLLARRTGTVFTRQDDGSAGCPAAFGAASYAVLRSLTGDAGARSLSLPDVLIIAPADNEILADVDTPGDLATLESRS